MGKKTITAACAALLCLAVPSAADAATRLVDPTGADAGDCTVTPCQHIQYAVNQAVANDTVQVAAGVYDTEPSNRVLINKGLTLQGAGIGQTILDGNDAHGLPQNGTLRVNTTTGDPVTVSGLTVREAGAIGTHAAGTHFGIFMEGIVPTTTQWTLDSVRVEGSNSATGRDYNLDVQNTLHNVEIRNSQFVDANFNPVLIERAQGPVDFHDNVIQKGPGAAAALFDSNHLANAGNPSAVAGLHRVRNNVVVTNGNSGLAFNAGFLGTTVGAFSALEVTDNQVSGLGPGSIGISLTNNGANPGTATAIQSATIARNTVTGPGGWGVRFAGLIQNIQASKNQLTGLTRGVQLIAQTGRTHGPGPSQFRFNRLVNDSTAGIDNAFGSAVDAEANWWGCNEGPNADPGCSPVTGANVDFTPWIVARLSASPTAIEIGGDTSDITANLRGSSAGGDFADGAHPDGFSVPFATDLGSVTSPETVADDLATSTLTSGATPGTANVTATIDNETVTTPVVIQDTVPPDTQIDSGPADGSTIMDPTPTFEFSSPDDPTATFQCSVDGGPFTACTSPFTTPPLADGPRTFAVRAVDVNNNPDPTPSTRSFTVDTTPPVVTIDSGPAPGSTISDPTPTFAFSSEPGATFTCSVDSPVPVTPCSSPFTSPTLSDGPHTFYVTATDAAGNTTTVSRSFIVDATPPDTTIDAGPAGNSRINDTTPTFEFSSPDGTATFECSIDGSNFAPCTSPLTLPALGEGPHTFSVRAVDPVGNADPTPAARSFNVDTTPPNTTINSGPADGSTTSDPTPTFEFASSEPGSSFECSVDGGGFTSCASPFTTSSLGAGAHTFSVRATDEATNTDATPATRSFTVDTGPPDTTITGGPAAGSTVSDSSPTFTFTSTEAGSTFECSVDGGAFSSCTSPRTVDLNDGTHTFAVRATDGAGNTDTTPASRTFTVDTTAPDTAILSGPADGSAGNPSSVTFTFGSSQVGSTFQCRLSKAGTAGAVYEPCTTPKIYAGLADGVYTFDVRATDASGNTDASPARSVFSVGSAPAPGAGTGSAGINAGSCVTNLRGTKSRNVINGTSASESIRGKGGNDLLRGKGGVDCIAGGAGNDVINSRDGLAEFIRCGKGRDRAIADKVDRLRSCEKSRIR